MIKVILIIAAYNMIMSFFVKRSFFACGLIGFVPKRRQEANLEWIKIIMSYNTLRGTDSCGIYMNNDVQKGISTQSDARVFLAENPLYYDDKCKNKTIIAHTRKSTRGANIAMNAHPFVLEHEGRTITLAHNGTIPNIESLARKYEVDTKQMFVDSQILAKIILMKGYDVLNYYEGGASLLFTYDDEPNVLYFFKGASRQFSTEKDLEDERPLAYIENHEGFYFSSLYHALDCCSNLEVISYTPTANQVVKIENGKFEVVYKANRRDANVSTYVPAVTTNRHTRSNNGGTSNNTIPSSNALNTAIKKTFSLKDAINIYKEITYANAVSTIMCNMIYYLAGRYYSIPSFVCKDFIDTKIDYNGHASPYDGLDAFLLNGHVSLNNVNNFMYEIYDHKRNNGVTKNVLTFYFIDGVLIDTAKEDTAIKQEKNIRSITNMHKKLQKLSNFSKYPITYLYSDAAKLSERFLIYFKDGKKADYTSYHPLFSPRRYTINMYGALVSIDTYSTIDDIFDSSLQLFSVPNEPVTTVEENEEKTVLIHCFDYEIEGTTKEYKVERYQHSTRDYEAGLLMEEELNGLSDLSYYVNEEWESPMSGHHLLRVSLAKYFDDVYSKEIGAETPAEKEEFVNIHFDEGMSSGEGFLSYMTTRWREANFMMYILSAIEDESINIIDDIDDDDFEDIEEYISEQKKHAVSFKNEEGNETFGTV